jgi:uncharacterized protein (DUF924 family)
VLILYAQLIHNEDVESVKKGVELMEALVKEFTTNEVKKFYDVHLAQAKDGLKIINKFKRFPSRNKLLNRQSTTEEEQLLTRGLSVSTTRRKEKESSIINNQNQ